MSKGNLTDKAATGTGRPMSGKYSGRQHNPLDTKRPSHTGSKAPKGHPAT